MLHYVIAYEFAGLTLRDVAKVGEMLLRVLTCYGRRDGMKFRHEFRCKIILKLIAMCCKRKTQNRGRSYALPGNTGYSRRPCCGRRNNRDGNFHGPRGLFGLSAHRIVQKRNEQNGVLEQGQKGLGSETYGAEEPVYHEKDMKEKVWHEKDTTWDMTIKKGDNEALVEQAAEERIGRRRVDEALGAGRRYESIVAPPKYEETVMKA
ncbi:hypothetical protein ACMFMG_000423 [Clarireedia jacksonii]